MKAIETVYKGYRFRSCLEARWAVFYDALGVAYLYEPEGFDLPSGVYLPDFYLPNVGDGLYVEIKPIAPTKDEERKLTDLSNATGRNATFRVGDPWTVVGAVVRDSTEDRHHDGSYHSDNAGVYSPREDGVSGPCDLPYHFCLCPWCGRVGFEFDGRGARVCGYKEHYDNEEDALAAIKHLGHWRADDKCYTGGHPRIVNAALAARSARFEHGESPRV